MKSRERTDSRQSSRIGERFAQVVSRWTGSTIVFSRRDFGATAAQANALYALAWANHLKLPAPYQGCPGFPRDPFG